MEYQTLGGKGSILIVEDGEEGADSYQVEMLKKNSFPGLLQVQVSVIDGKKEYFYEAEKYVTLETYLERKTIDMEMLQGYLTGLKELLAFLEEYLLEPDCLCMQPGHIYIDDKEQILKFCYGAYEQEQFGKGLIKLWQFFLQKLDYSDRQNVVMAYEIYQNIVREGYASAFTYKKKEDVDTPEIVFPWEEEDGGLSGEEEWNETKKEEMHTLQLPEKWKFYAAGIAVCGVAAGICYWLGSLMVTGLVLLAAAGLLYVLIHLAGRDKGIDSVQNTW